MLKNCVLEEMERLKVPITRENFIDFAYLGDPPDPWTCEDEASLPIELQDWAAFSNDDESMWPDMSNELVN
jgi:hypothetical protein